MNGPLPLYQPVDLATQVRHAEKVLAITANAVDKAVQHGRMNPVEAACEKQRCQSIVRTLHAVRDLVGPGATVTSAADLAGRMAA